MLRLSILAFAVAVLTVALPCGALPLQQQEPRSFVDSLRTIILEGDAELGIPVLDPFTLDYINGSIDNAQGELSDLVVKGLAGFEADSNVHLSVIGLAIKVDVDVIVPELRAAADYAFDGVFQVNGGDSHLFGAGALEASINELSVRAEVEIRPGVTGLLLHKLDIELGLDGLEAHFKGLLGGGLVDEFLSAILSELALELFQEQRPLLEKALEEALRVPLEEALKDYSYNDLLCLLLNICSEEDNPTQLYHLAQY